MRRAYIRNIPHCRMFHSHYCRCWPRCTLHHIAVRLETLDEGHARSKALLHGQQELYRHPLDWGNWLRTIVRRRCCHRNLQDMPGPSGGNCLYQSVTSRLQGTDARLTVRLTKGNHNQYEKSSHCRTDPWFSSILTCWHTASFGL